MRRRWPQLTRRKHLRRVADEVTMLWVDPEFQSVGQYYAEFTQITDAEVMALLPLSAEPRGRVARARRLGLIFRYA